MADHEQDQRTVNEILAENLRYFMGEKSLTQSAMAAKADMAQTTVSLYMNPQRRTSGKSGKEPSAKLAEVQRLADALEVELWELLRPLSPVQRQLYRSVEAAVREAAQATARVQKPARPSTSVGQEPPRPGIDKHRSKVRLQGIKPEESDPAQTPRAAVPRES